MKTRKSAADTQREKLAESGGISTLEASKILGVSDWTVRRLAKAGALSHARIGGRIVIPREAVVQYLAAQTALGRIA